MSFRMQVKCYGHWADVHPSGGEPYEYATEDEALAVLRACYPDQCAFGDLGVVVRVVSTDPLAVQEPLPRG